MINFSDFLLPSSIIMILALISSILVLKIPEHTKYIRYMHFIGRFYIFLIYFTITFNPFNQDSLDFQSLSRSGLALLFSEEIIVWFIERFFPTNKRRK